MYITPFVTNISIFLFTENAEFGLSMKYNVYTPALEDKFAIHIHTALDRCQLFSKHLFSLSPPLILRTVYFCYEM